MILAHREFHAAVAAATGNALFELLTRPLYQISDGAELDAVIPGAYWAGVDADHRALLQCLIDGDSAGAVAVSERHLDRIDGTFRT
jgi:DNA-binding FadR family transcriptional regulator